MALNHPLSNQFEIFHLLHPPGYVRSSRLSLLTSCMEHNWIKGFHLHVLLTQNVENSVVFVCKSTTFQVQ